MPIDKMLNGLGNSGALTGALSGAAGGALVSAFTNKKSAKKLLKTGGLLAVGGLAWGAYQSYRRNQTAAPVSAAEALGPEPASAIDAVALEKPQFDAVVDHSSNNPGPLLVLRAMVAAAHADGHLTADEQQKIWQHALTLDLPSATLADLEKELKQPASIEALAETAPNLETKIELYTASLVVIDDTCEQGQIYLQSLAAKLQIPAPLVDALHLHASQSQIAA